MIVAYYVGAPGTGKTTLACLHALESAKARAVPALLVDSEGVVERWKFDADTVPWERLASHVWREGRHARYVPSGGEEMPRLFDAVRSGGDIVLIVDEISYWGKGTSLSPELARLFRMHRNRRVDIFATSQYPADIAPLIWNVKSDAYVFQNDGDAALDRLERECGLEREKVKALPDFQFFHYSRRNVLPPPPPPPAAAPSE